MANLELVDTDRALEAVITTLRSEPAYGLDTEFVAERSYRPKLCLIQIAWSGGLALIDPLACDVSGLSEVLLGPGTMITHAGSGDLPIIERACGARPTCLFDTQLSAGFIGMSQPSLASLVWALLRIRLDKGDQLSDWSRRPLPESVLDYAAGDVAHLFTLRDELIRQLEANGRTEWAATECEILRASSSRYSDPDTTWWKIKGSRSLKGEQAAIAQSLSSWREHRAETEDLPPRFVMSDLALAALVQRPPNTAADVLRVRGAGNLSKSSVAQILSAIESARAMSPSDLKLPPKHSADPSLDAASGLLTGWTSQVAENERIDPRLLATRDDVKALVNERPSRLDNGWRAKMVGDDLRALLNGESVLRFIDGGSKLSLESSPRD